MALEIGFAVEPKGCSYLILTLSLIGLPFLVWYKLINKLSLAWALAG